MYILSESMSHIFHFFCEMACDISLVSLDPYSIHHSIYFRCDYFSYFDVGWLSLTFLSLCFLLSLFCSFISPYLIWFLSFLVLLNVWLGFSLHTLFLLIWCVHSFIITFCVETLRSRIHDIFYALHLMHEGYVDYIIGIFEPSFHLFRSPYYLGLRYVPRLKTTLRLLLCIVFDDSHMGNTWDWLEIISWGMTDRELRRWIYTGAYPFYQWWIFGGDMIYIGAYPAHRWRFLSEMTLHTEA